ncbi:hypothetical protein [Streptomyces sp. NPDC087212]|uniref:hypothetical protein n=1 Tax=Streptomyces sp. NPDC087212 TaxID=3365766 RepID=UPI00381F7555
MEVGSPTHNPSRAVDMAVELRRHPHPHPQGEVSGADVNPNPAKCGARKAFPTGPEELTRARLAPEWAGVTVFCAEPPHNADDLGALHRGRAVVEGRDSVVVYWRVHDSRTP